ncbi:prephenate dehydrogenase [Kitasatospora sp. MAP5-34]|uniref:prephenate dehydrogenase n=1 Tax=Kitasatospora sp. MAP5-34 TaxID=3035102 RepID=UPI002475B29B|nr:prephenate dehydrogenase [Kitasatospora sp. MAP5-34]
MRTAAVVGTGLIGTSVALALARRGIVVHLLDTDESAVRTASSMGAGVVGRCKEPVDMAVLAVPPARIGVVLAAEQANGLARSYTDVASVKAEPEWDVLQRAVDPTSYIGGHPMAGRERSGPLAACATLFEGRSWVLTPSPTTSRETLNRALELVALCGSVPVLMDSGAHDRAVALVSHTPHVVSALMAARLQHAPDEASQLAGQGLRDVTRIAGGDPRLWGDILEANAGAVADVLGELAEDLTVMVAALRGLATEDADERAQGMTLVADLLDRGNKGRDRIPGKHGTGKPVCIPVRVLIGDQPGELARLLAAAAELEVNVEDMTIDHSPGSVSGLAELMVAPAAAVRTVQWLQEHGWTVQRIPGVGNPPRPGRPPQDDGLTSHAKPAAAGRH